MDCFLTQESILNRFQDGLCRSTHTSAQQQIAIAVAGDAAAGMHGENGLYTKAAKLADQFIDDQLPGQHPGAGRDPVRRGVCAGASPPQAPAKTQTRAADISRQDTSPIGILSAGQRRRRSPQAITKEARDRCGRPVISSTYRACAPPVTRAVWRRRLRGRHGRRVWQSARGGLPRRGSPPRGAGVAGRRRRSPR